MSDRSHASCARRGRRCDATQVALPYLRVCRISDDGSTASYLQSLTACSTTAGNLDSLSLSLLMVVASCHTSGIFVALLLVLVRPESPQVEEDGVDLAMHVMAVRTCSRGFFFSLLLEKSARRIKGSRG